MFRIKVKPYMTKESTTSFDFMRKWNNNIPMPLLVMTGTKLEETRGMVKMSLHGDLSEEGELISCCMKCGRPITNPVSQYFGLGPVCGQHNYTNPFDTEEELKAAIHEYRSKLNEITWTGWIIKSAIVEVEELGDEPWEDSAQLPTELSIYARINRSSKINSYYSAFLSFEYNPTVVACIKALPIRRWLPDRKEWEIPFNRLDQLLYGDLPAALEPAGCTLQRHITDEVEIYHSDNTSISA